MGSKTQKIFAIIFRRTQNGLEYLALTPNFEPGRNTKPYVVTGGVEPGESPDAAARREVVEEIGVTPIKIIDLQTALSYEDRITHEQVVEHCYGVEIGSESITLDMIENIAYEWLSADMFVATIWWEGDRAELRKFIATIEAS